MENTNSEYEKEKLSERLAKLSDGVAVLKVIYGSLYFVHNKTTDWLELWSFEYLRDQKSSHKHRLLPLFSSCP